MATLFEFISKEWSDWAPELARWAFERLVNRTDVWGSYVSMDRRKRADGRTNLFFTAPFPAARGKVFLTPALLRRHFAPRDEGDLVSLHSTSADKTSRWLAIDIDRHDESVSAENNFAAARAWYEKLVSKGFDPLLFDTNGDGGYHILVIFSKPVPTADVFTWGQAHIADYARYGLTRAPETYPKQICIEEGHFGNCLRLPGRHHTREFYSRVWSGEPDNPEWLEGASAIARMIGTATANPALIPAALPVEADVVKTQIVTARRPRICIDFDGVLASYDGWKGLDFMGAPIAGAVDFTRRLAAFADVVIFTSRCCVELHRDELKEPHRPASDLAPRLQHNIRYWLEKHGFTFHEIYIGQGKPAASAYIDDRAIHCSPQVQPDAFTRALANAKLLCAGRAPGQVSDDARLRALIEAWPTLSDACKAKVMKLAGGK